MSQITPAVSLHAAWRSLVLADGTPRYGRALEPSDREEVGRLFARLSPRSRYQRFHGPKPTLTERDLGDLTRIDHVAHEALAVFDARDSSLVAVARYVRLRGLRTLTATILWENQSGRALLRRLGFRTRRSAGPTIEVPHPNFVDSPPGGGGRS